MTSMIQNQHAYALCSGFAVLMDEPTPCAASGSGMTTNSHTAWRSSVRRAGLLGTGIGKAMARARQLFVGGNP